VIAELFATSTQFDPGDVHVWRFPNAQPVDASMLSADELATAARFSIQKLRDDYIAQHAIQRALLARYVDTVEITRGPRGKPRVTGIHHNLAHAEDFALLAIAYGEVGVDLERYDAAIDPAKLAPFVLAADEKHCTGRREFLRIWTRKEACLKATGVGLLDDLTTVSVIADSIALDGVTLYLRDLPFPDHAAALATTAPCGPLYFVKS
jgi:phosphopantetheinyl transferase